MAGVKRIPWSWDPEQFRSIGPIIGAWRRGLRQYRRRRMGYPKAHWCDHPSRILEPEELDGRDALFDSYVMLALRQGDERVARLVERARRRCLSVITYMDMLAASTAFKESFVIESFIQGNDFEVVPMSEPISRRAALYMEYYGVARGLSPRSALVGATAYEEGLVLVSCPKEFGRLPEMEIVAFPT